MAKYIAADKRSARIVNSADSNPLNNGQKKKEEEEEEELAHHHY